MDWNKGQELGIKKCTIQLRLRDFGVLGLRRLCRKESGFVAENL